MSLDSTENRVEWILFYRIDIFSARWRNMREIPKKKNRLIFRWAIRRRSDETQRGIEKCLILKFCIPHLAFLFRISKKMIVCVHRNRVSKTYKWSMLRTCLACIDGYNYSTYSSYVKHVENADTYMYLNGFDQMCNWRVLFGIQIGILASAFRVLKYFRI